MTRPAFTDNLLLIHCTRARAHTQNGENTLLPPALNNPPQQLLPTPPTLSLLQPKQKPHKYELQTNKTPHNPLFTPTNVLLHVFLPKTRETPQIHRRRMRRGTTWANIKKKSLVEASKKAVGPAEGSDSGVEEISEEEGEESEEQSEGDREEADGRESSRWGSVCGELHVHAG